MVEGKGVEPDGGGKGDKGMDLMVKVAGSSMPRAPGLVQHLLVDLVPVINQHNLPPPSLTHHGPSKPHPAKACSCKARPCVVSVAVVWPVLQLCVVGVAVVWLVLRLCGRCCGCVAGVAVRRAQALE